MISIHKSKKTQDNLQIALKQAEKNNGSRIGLNDKSFIKRIYYEGIEKYVDRLKAIGFSGNKHVLDAGCGYGQWSLALALLNEKVSACDISNVRADFLSDLVHQLNLDNLNLIVSGIDEMPYENNTFDAVFCYGVIFLTPWRKSLAELVRVLKPGGKVYVNANGLGWYMFLWEAEHNKTADYDPKALAAQTLNDTLKYEREGEHNNNVSLVIEPNDLIAELEKFGFKDFQLASEGCLHLDHAAAKPKPFFKGKYKGLTGVFEMVAQKKDHEQN